MESPGEQTTSELESFRQTWISDLQLRSENSVPPTQEGEPSSSSQPEATQSQRSSDWPWHLIADDELVDPVDKSTDNVEKKKLVSALDHYEEAMEKEAEGNMGESLRLYRKAYRMDTRVDRTYREKHVETKASSSSDASSSTQKPNSNTQASEQSQTQTIHELIASFSDLKVEPAPPIIEGTPPPPCPISKIPTELLVHIITQVAVADVGELTRVVLVCKQFAYLVATEQGIWKRLCLGSEFGFSAMHRYYQTGMDWSPLDVKERGEDGSLISMPELQKRYHAEAVLQTKSLTPSFYPTWQHHFRNRPRIRFNGCYISTVNYVRTGQASTNQSTWGGPPVLIVTYYRYLRFFRDGGAISLLSLSPPAEVVHHLTPELLLLHRDASRNANHPSAVMKHAYRGRWRQSTARDHPENTDPKDQEADLWVETEGVGPKYTYRMDLSLRNAGKTGRNNKIVWRNFYSYDNLTDELAEFPLRNDKPFFFSRVKSYGVWGM